MNATLSIISVLFVTLTGYSHSQVYSDANIPPEPGDEVGNEISLLLSNTETLSKRFRDIKPEELSKFCAFGIRITHKPAFTNPRTLVVLFDIEPVSGKLINSLAWVEYSATDYTTLTIHRIVKAIPIQNPKETKKLILSTPLWHQMNQRDIPGFQDANRDGDYYFVDLINGTDTKTLKYHVPDSFNDPHNNKFRDDLFILLQSLNQAGAPFNLYSPEWRKRVQAAEKE